MIGYCDCCDRGPVPVANVRSSSGECTACYLCQAAPWDSPDPDPYGELEPQPAYDTVKERDMDRDDWWD